MKTLALSDPSVLNRVGGLPKGVIDALRRLEHGASEDEIAQEVIDNAGAGALPSLYHALHRLRGFVSHTLHWQSAALATLTPLSTAHSRAQRKVRPDERYQLSRFASAHREGCAWIVESPHAHATVTLHDRRAAALLVDLAAPVTARELAGALPLEVVCALLDLFLEASLIGDESAALGRWEPHDLWFHARSRRGRDAGPYGASKRDDPPPVVPSFDAPTLPLDRPDIDRLRAHDVSFTEVVESRRSIRKFGAQPMTRRDLGELLFRAARIRARRGEHLSDRPYPGGGACYELEIYPVVRQCAGLEPGLYHYDAEQHRLHVLGDPSILMEEAALSAGAEQAQVLLVLSARFQRVSCKYAAMGYALILKNAGVLMHAIALVAQAMGLGACPLGGGDAALFARVAGTDPLVETSVAEILVGST